MSKHGKIFSKQLDEVLQRSAEIRGLIRDICSDHSEKKIEQKVIHEPIKNIDLKTGKTSNFTNLKF